MPGTTYKLLWYSVTTYLKKIFEAVPSMKQTQSKGGEWDKKTPWNKTGTAKRETYWKHLIHQLASTEGLLQLDKFRSCFKRSHQNKYQNWKSCLIANLKFWAMTKNLKRPFCQNILTLQPFLKSLPFFVNWLKNFFWQNMKKKIKFAIFCKKCFW